MVAPLDAACEVNRVRRGANPCTDVGWGWGREARRVPAGGARRKGGPGRSRTCRRGRPGRRRDPLAAKEEIAGDRVGRDGERVLELGLVALLGTRVNSEQFLLL